MEGCACLSTSSDDGKLDSHFHILEEPLILACASNFAFYILESKLKRILLSAANMTSSPYETPVYPTCLNLLTRWFMDTRSLTASSPSLPLLSTLQPSDQETIKKFYRLSDRHMSLASYLLKYLFIHRTCRVPWHEIVISRTPEPHKRPCYISPSLTDNGNGGRITPDVEFNISHQASLVALAGCAFRKVSVSQPRVQAFPDPSSNTVSAMPQIGIDITCTDDPTRRTKDSIPKTEEALHAFVDIFSDVFSQRELETIKSALDPRSGDGGHQVTLEQSIRYRIRLFYTYWALKEAYIKMTGEALLAPWLRELEFTDVIVPKPTADRENSGDCGPSVLGAPETGIQIWLHGEKVNDARIEIVAFERDYLIATAGRGGGFGHPTKDGAGMMAKWDTFRRIDLEADISPCATGQCQCLV